MNRKHLWIITCILSFYTSYAQQIKGQILDAKELNPIPYVNIVVKKTGTFSDDNGDFRIKLNDHKIRSNDTLVFTHINYNILKLSYSDFLELNKSVHLDIKTEVLSEVSVKSKRQLNGQLKFSELSSLIIPVNNFGSIAINDKIYITGGEQSSLYDGYRETVVDNNLEYQEPSSVSIKDFIEESVSTMQYHEFSNKIQVYNISKDKWSVVENIEIENRAFHNLNRVDNTIYIIGGKQLSKRKRIEYLSNTIERFNTSTNSVKVDYTNPHQAVNFGSVVVNNNLITIGGSIKTHNNGNINYISKDHIYDIKTGNWYDLETEPLLNECSSVAINNTIYILENDKVNSILKSLDLETNKLITELKLKENPPITSITKSLNEIYLYSPGKIHVYNTDTKTIYQYFVNISVKNPNLEIAKNKLYIFGGLAETEYSQYPSEKVYAIDLSEFLNTRIISYFESE